MKRKCGFIAVIIFVIFFFSARDSFTADYIPEPKLVATEPVDPPEPVAVDVELTASPDNGPAPLPVTFTCTATAEIHYADERWALPPQGSVEQVIPLYKKVPANITSQPADQTLKKVKTYTFKAEAEYQGLKGQDTTKVVVNNYQCTCPAFSNRRVYTTIFHNISNEDNYYSEMDSKYYNSVTVESWLWKIEDFFTGLQL
ncbi:MAG: hypothetical protein CVU78_01685 [Elusimicrobia bacterium HGW-Elusimicrobia-2]|nr:MAG: hypothetical protein CVU78_01685 [Elusimicrobia bacterium HGW-Elusimicrobia-2]